MTVKKVQKVQKVSKPDVFRTIRNAKTLKISEVESDPSLEVWAINIAASTHGRTAQVVISVKASNGDSKIITVPDTWIPVCLTNNVPKQNLLQSSEFRQGIGGSENHGPLIRLISAADAQSILEFPEAIKEANRLRERKKALKAVRSERGEHPNLADGAPMKKSGPSDMVRNLILSHNNEQLDEESLVNTLKANSGRFKLPDYEYMAAESNSGKVKRWAAKKLSS